MNYHAFSDLDYEAGTTRVERVCDLPAWSTVKEAVASLPPLQIAERPSAPVVISQPVYVRSREVETIEEWDEHLRRQWMRESVAHCPERLLRVMKAASIMHLADLKRAGHRCSETEFYVPEEPGRKFVPHGLAQQSFTGSHGALCADDGAGNMRFTRSRKKETSP